MPDRLPGGSDQVDVLHPTAMILEKTLHGSSEDFAEEKVEVADGIDARLAGIEKAEDSGSQFGWKRIAVEGEQIHLRLFTVAGDLHQRGVNAIDRGSGHETHDQSRLLDRNVQQAPDAVHAPSTSRRLPRWASRSLRASSAETSFLAMTVASRTLPAASRRACTAAGRFTPAASSTIRTARLRSFSFVAGISIIRLE